jgi:alkylation response protein AidB-like acyl-CoA dehydrogenase
VALTVMMKVAECVGERCSEVAHRLASPATRPFRAREAALCIERDLVREMGELGFLGPELPESLVAWESIA